MRSASAILLSFNCQKVFLVFAPKYAKKKKSFCIRIGFLENYCRDIYEGFPLSTSRLYLITKFWFSKIPCCLNSSPCILLVSLCFWYIHCFFKYDERKKVRSEYLKSDAFSHILVVLCFLAPLVFSYTITISNLSGSCGGYVSWSSYPYTLTGPSCTSSGSTYTVTTEESFDFVLVTSIYLSCSACSTHNYETWMPASMEISFENFGSSNYVIYLDCYTYQDCCSPRNVLTGPITLNYGQTFTNTTCYQQKFEVIVS